jgi:superfamily II DNA or RNA helicase/diadenosine tetraphosphate (Ap4A) HIT family hydrolase/SOS-response transcriptional repressor LexA
LRTSPFLEVPEAEWVASNELAFAIRDRFPVSPGHTLVVTRRVVSTWFEATPAERAAVMALVEEVKRRLDEELGPDGYNVGYNSGAAAGQTVMHLHVHVIPRFRGDMEDPRGGVRHVIPARGNYLRSAALTTGGVADPLLAHVRPLFSRAHEIAIVAAFVQDRGLDVIGDDVGAALARGARLRLITGDYLHITQSAALSRLLGWQLVAREEGQGAFEARVVEVERLLAPTRSFHPKSWRFETPDAAVAFVGSSNLSDAALRTGIEWNLRVERGRDPAAYEAVRAAFEELWQRAIPLTSDWVRAYVERAREESPARLPPGEAEAEPLAPPPPPHELQKEALEALRKTRAEGHGRALAVLATGLGKTWLAAFDVARLALESGTFPRVLFLAHRAELLGQAAETFRRVRYPSLLRLGWFIGAEDQLDGEVVLASVQKLSRPEHLARLERGGFDYVIVDEVHHATAASYRRVIERLAPRFLLGLTATPERADEGDVLGLFDDNLAYRADLGVGIERELLSPFAYYGLKDTVDYANIPWRNHRFDPEILAAAVETRARMERMWAAWLEHPGTRTLVFCCSVRHAELVAAWLRERGVRAAAVYAGGTTDRAQALRDLAGGALDALCAVDLFNEGVDLPAVDRVVMLRPTESPVLFLQQLGRGLRKAAGKDRLMVIDFVGNHGVFVGRLRTLLSLGSASAAPLRAFLEGQAPELPPGCSVDVELEAKDLLRRFLQGGRSEAERVYRELRDERDARPTAGELARMGYPPTTLRRVHGSWFGFVDSEGDLDADERAALDAGRGWFELLETTPMTKCFKMVVLEALLEAEALETGLPLAELAARSHEVLVRSPELFRDLEEVQELPDPRHPEPARWLAYWNRNPVAAWSPEGGAFFRVAGDRLVPRLPLPDAPAAREAFASMTRELVDLRLAQYRLRARSDDAGSAFECKVLWNQRDPILKLPSRAAHAGVPHGELDVRLPDGHVWQFRFAKEFCNVARAPGAARNGLPDLLRGWFGPAAGRPGTAFHVRFSRSPDGWWIEPRGQILELPRPGRIVAYPSLRAAAGAATDLRVDAPEPELVRLPVDSVDDQRFAVRATGDSMDGGRQPIRDGDWLVLHLARGAGIGAVRGRVALVQIPDPREGLAYQVKRIVEEGGRWRLRSDNPARPSYDATDESVVIAALERVVRPEDLAPAVGEQLDEPAFRRWFDVDQGPVTGRLGGHLFVCVDRRGPFIAPDRLRVAIPDRRPGETAFVLARSGETWRYCGVGRWLDEEGAFALPDLDHATWRSLGEGRSSSRRLPAGAIERAKALVEQLLASPGVGAFIGRDGRRARIAGRATDGGLRIDGGDGGFAARTVSLTDLAWALVAEDDVASAGGVLDEARVNRLRYLDGTPKASTRFIDTGWALAALVAVRSPGG